MVEEVLLPQRVLLARHIPAAHPIARPGAAATTTPARIPRMRAIAAPKCTRARARCVRVRILGGGGNVGPAAQQLVAVLAVQHVVARVLDGVELPAVLGQLGAEVSDALVGLVLLGGVELLLSQRAVLVDGSLEGGKGGRERAEGGGAGDRGRR